MKIVFIADPLEKIKPKGDSTLSLLRSALRRGHVAYWAEASDLYLRDNLLTIRPRLCLECEPATLPRLAAPANLPIDTIELIFIRRDPPFDAEYLKLCWLLTLVEHKIEIINRPSILLRHHEKMVPLQALAHGYLEPTDLIPTFLGETQAAQDYVFQDSSIEKIVTKPFLGFGGQGLDLLDRKIFLGLNPHHPAELIQPFQDEVFQGDRRVFFLGGKILASFVRIPKSGGFISNLAQGGSAISRALTQPETAALLRLGDFLKFSGIELAGADLIGAKISEVNVTSPTGLQSLLALEKKDYADDIIAFAEQHRTLPSPSR